MPCTRPTGNQQIDYRSTRRCAAVEDRLEAARRSGESFVGIIAGVVPVLAAGRTPAAPDGTYGARVAAIVGTPLVEVPSG